MAEKNQDKNQSEKKAEQAEEHDESVLNPEIKIRVRDKSLK